MSVLDTDHGARGAGPVRLGLAQLVETLRGRRVGYIANHTSVAADLTHLGHLLRERDVDLRCFLAPEHGLWGDVYAGHEVAAAADPTTGLPVHSLFAKTAAGRVRKPAPEMLAGLDTLLFDLQDVGARYYTYISTMSLAMEAAAEQSIAFVVLDRPNPIGGRWVDGWVSKPEERSFVAIHPLPVQHAMTVGELARLFNQEFDIGAELTVVPMEGWRRSMFFDETGLPWVPPSPNMPALTSAMVYTCSNVVGANLSVGLGTTRPFELVGAPWVDPFAYAAALNRLGLPGVRFRPAYFFVHYGPHAGQRCGGVQIHVLDRSAFHASECAAHMTVEACALYPEQSAPQRPEIGRHRIEPAGRSAAEIIASWQADLARFRAVRAAYLQYPE